MKELFLTLFFCGIVNLTPGYIVLSKSPVVVSPDKPIEAVTSGANLQIDISLIAGVNPELSALDEIFPKGIISATLITKTGKKIELKNKSSYSFSKNSVRIILDDPNIIQSGKKYVKIILKSQKYIGKVRLFWVECKK